MEGGYTQEDIVNVAKAFTGWIIERQDAAFRFAPGRHDRSEKVVLGKTIKPGGMDEGERVLDIVATHPSTARHIATKLAIRFVSDNPPASLIDRAAATFTATKGDLREVVRVILTSQEFAAADAYRAKVKTPLEFVASALRATGADVAHGTAAREDASRHGHAAVRLPAADRLRRNGGIVGVGGSAGQPHEFRGGSLKNGCAASVPLSAEQTLAMKIGAPEFQRQ